MDIVQKFQIIYTLSFQKNLKTFVTSQVSLILQMC